VLDGPAVSNRRSSRKMFEEAFQDSRTTAREVSATRGSGQSRIAKLGVPPLNRWPHSTVLLQRVHLPVSGRAPGIDRGNRCGILALRGSDRSPIV
jgi:hypothetical protein